MRDLTCSSNSNRNWGNYTSVSPKNLIISWHNEIYQLRFVWDNSEDDQEQLHIVNASIRIIIWKPLKINRISVKTSICRTSVSNCDHYFNRQWRYNFICSCWADTHKPYLLFTSILLELNLYFSDLRLSYSFFVVLHWRK